MMTVMGFLVVAFVATIVAALGKFPIWVAVLLLYVVELIRTLPLGR